MDDDERKRTYPSEDGRGKIRIRLLSGEEPSRQEVIDQLRKGENTLPEECREYISMLLSARRS